MRAGAWAVLVCLAAPSRASAMEPCSAPVSIAIKKAVLVFVGRVVAAREVGWEPPFRSELEATVTISKCLKGNECQERHTVVVRYSFADPNRLGVDLSVGGQYLFAFRQTAERGVVRFDTRWRDDCTDMAYVVGGGVTSWSEGDDSRVLTNLWLNIREEATLLLLEQAVQAAQDIPPKPPTRAAPEVR